MKWSINGKQWPHIDHSKLVAVGGRNLHVQVMGKGPSLLLLHGTGASTHSWRDCVPFLKQHFKLVIPDLPGHGFSDLPPEQCVTLPGMAQDLSDLLRALKVKPRYIAGHSAGAAIAARMVLDGQVEPEALISLNGALLPFPGLASVVFPALAKVLFLNPFSIPIATHMTADKKTVGTIIERTGAALDADGLAYYECLFQAKRHVTAAINMMARWDLNTLKADIRRLQTKLTLVSGERDLAVPTWVARSVCEILPDTHSILLPDRGHLAHEEKPEEVCNIIVEQAFEAGILRGP